MIDYDSWKNHLERTYQEIINKLKTHDRVCCVRYTGYGKSYFLIKRLYDNLDGKKLILTSNNSLTEEFISYGCDALTYTKVHSEILADDNKFINKYKDVSYLILDEAHLAASRKRGCSLQKFINRLNNVKLIGFTATPLRPSDGINIVDYIFNGSQVEPFNIDDGIKHNFIHKIKYIKASFNVDKVIQSEPLIKEYKQALSKYNINTVNVCNIYNIDRIIAKHYNVDKNGNKIIIFCPKISTINKYKDYFYKVFRKIFPDKSISSWTWTWKDVDDSAYSKFKNSTSFISLLFAVNKANHGVHLKEVNTVIFMRKTSSEIIYLQQLGRAINEKEPIVFDFSNNCDNLAYNHKRYKAGKGKRKDGKELLDMLEIIDYTVDFNLIYNKIKNITKELSDSDIKYIQENSQKLFLSNIAKHLNKSKFQIKQYCIDNNIAYIENIGDLTIADYKFLDDNIGIETFKSLAIKIVNSDERFKNVEDSKRASTIIEVSKTISHYYKDIKFNEYLEAKKNYKEKLYNKRVDYIKNNVSYKSKAELAEDLQCTINEVNSICKELNVKPQNLSYKRLSSANKQKINSMYNILSSEQICSILNIGIDIFNSFIQSDEFNPTAYK